MVKHVIDEACGWFQLGMTTVTVRLADSESCTPPCKLNIIANVNCMDHKQWVQIIPFKHMRPGSSYRIKKIKVIKGRGELSFDWDVNDGPTYPISKNDVFVGTIRPTFKLYGNNKCTFNIQLEVLHVSDFAPCEFWMPVKRRDNSMELSWGSGQPEEKSAPKCPALIWEVHSFVRAGDQLHSFSFIPHSTYTTFKFKKALACEVAVADANPVVNSVSLVTNISRPAIWRNVASGRHFIVVSERRARKWVRVKRVAGDKEIFDYKELTELVELVSFGRGGEQPLIK